jgi:hypothetical protein
MRGTCSGNQFQYWQFRKTPSRKRPSIQGRESGIALKSYQSLDYLSDFIHNHHDAQKRLFELTSVLALDPTVAVERSHISHTS